MGLAEEFEILKVENNTMFFFIKHYLPCSGKLTFLLGGVLATFITFGDSKAFQSLCIVKINVLFLLLIII